MRMTVRTSVLFDSGFVPPRSKTSKTCYSMTKFIAKPESELHGTTAHDRASVKLVRKRADSLDIGIKMSFGSDPG